MDFTAAERDTLLAALYELRIARAYELHPGHAKEREAEILALVDKLGGDRTAASFSRADRNQ